MKIHLEGILNLSPKLEQLLSLLFLSSLPTSSLSLGFTMSVPDNYEDLYLQRAAESQD